MAVAGVAAAGTHALGSGIGPWKLGQPYAKRPGLVHSERIAGNGGPGCVGGPGSASRIDYYRTMRVAWRNGTRGRVYLIDVATTAAGDRSAEGFVVGSSRFAAVRRSHAAAAVKPARDRFALGARSLTVTRASGKETFVSLVYWFDARGVLNAFELVATGC